MLDQPINAECPACGDIVTRDELEYHGGVCSKCDLYEAANDILFFPPI